MSKHSRKGSTGKPPKPYPDFPLFPHDAGVWAKKVRGRLHYFGPWSDPMGAFQKWKDQEADLRAGRTPRASADGLTIRELANRYLTAKQTLVNSGEILPTTFAEYHSTCKRLAEAFGLNRTVDDLAADDFQRLRADMAKVWGPVRLANGVQRVRSVFKFGYDSGLIDKPVRYGPAFKKPSIKVLRRERTKRGARLFEPSELRAILKAAPPTLKAMILLGINCGYGCTDCASLPKSALDLERGWIAFPRPKTGIARRCPLWPETVAAIKEALACRPRPRDNAHNDLVFITAHGLSFAAGQTHWRVSGETAKLLRRIKIKVMEGGNEVEKPLFRRGMSFYGLRHTFQTIGDGGRDPVAVQAIMGHAPGVNDMGAVYREKVDDDRLRAVTDYVRSWLFGESATVL